MNLWSLVYFSAFIFYVFSGVFVLRLNQKAMVNRFFALICASLAAWSLGFAFSTGAKTMEEALAWRGISTFGWTFFYGHLFLFIVHLTRGDGIRGKMWPYLVYISCTAFFMRFLYWDTGNYILSTHGWVYQLYYKGPWSIAFDLFYLTCVAVSLIMLILWRTNTTSRREKKQAEIVMISLFGGLIGGGLTDTVLPLFGIRVLPLGVLFCAIAILGMWTAITKYKLMYLTQDIAAEHVLVTMNDPVIVLTPQGRIGQANRAAAELTGYGADEILGELVQGILPEFIPEHPISRELEERGLTNGHELKLATKSGNAVVCLCSGVYVHSEFGEKIGVILVLHDITGIKEGERLLKQANEALETKISKIHNVFDNVHEGILTFREDLLVQSEYSQECVRLFGGPIELLAIPELFYPQDAELRVFVGTLLKRIFEVDGQMRQLYMPLLPELLEIDGAKVMAKYKYTTDAQQIPMIMVILTDMTEKHELESKMERERQTLRMVVKAMLHREDFLELIEEYKRFASEELIKDHEEVLNGRERLLMRLHTFKGNFSQFDMLHLVDRLHELESEILATPKNTSLNIPADKLLGYLDQDLAVIDDVVGIGYFDEDTRIRVDSRQLDELKQAILQHMGPLSAKGLLERVNRFYFRSLKDMLSQCPDYTLRLAERWHRRVAPFDIEGDVVMVDPAAFSEFTRVLMHLFRNAVAHAIESEDERIEQGKAPEGKISCRIMDRHHAILLVVEDDGRGIDPVAVAKRAIDQGLLTQADLHEMEERDILKLVFLDFLSTADQPNYISGRGVGLPAVKRTVETMGGTIELTSTLGAGTRFSIMIPK